MSLLAALALFCLGLAAILVVAAILLDRLFGVIRNIFSGRYP